MSGHSFTGIVFAVVAFVATDVLLYQHPSLAGRVLRWPTILLAGIVGTWVGRWLTVAYERHAPHYQ